MNFIDLYQQPRNCINIRGTLPKLTVAYTGEKYKKSHFHYRKVAHPTKMSGEEVINCIMINIFHHKEFFKEISVSHPSYFNTISKFYVLS